MVNDTIPIEWRVTGTLAWFSTLGRAISLPELERLLLKEPSGRTEIEKTLSRLEAKVQERRGRYWIKGATVHHPTAKAKRAYRYKWWRVNLAVGLLRHVPFVRLVAVGNTLADQTAGEDSDIDLFIVTDPKRLFTARLAVTVLLQAAGLRRHGKKVADRMCLSFWATTEHLGLSDIAFGPYDIYLAYWIAGLRPVLDGGSTYREFLKANRWVRKYVPGYADAGFEAPAPGTVAAWQERLLAGRIGDWLEERLAAFQLKRIDTEPRPDEPDVRIVADRTMLKFHEKERRKTYRAEWELLMRSLGFDPKHITQ